jgi:cation:H+ antiporter
MTWIQFIASAGIVIAAAIKLAEYGDAIAYHTKLTGLFIGALLVAGATSLPELLTMINAINQRHIDLTAGDLFGSSMFNMLLLGALDMIFHRTRIIRRVALRHALTASLGTMLTGMAVFFLLADVDLRIGWVGIGSLLIMAMYFTGVWLLRSNPVLGGVPSDQVEGITRGIPSLRRAVIGFTITAAVLILVTPWLVRGSSGIADLTGLGDGFIGVVMVAVVTSLPELVAMVSAVRFGAYDIAVGNLFGSNVFNMFALSLADVFYAEGPFLNAIDPAFALAGLLALLMTTLGLMGNLAQVERRIGIIEVDALLLIVCYFAGLGLLYTRGIGA